MQYSENTIYGINLILKDYANFPRFLPLPCHMEHGWTPLSDALPSDLEIDKPLMLVFSKRRQKSWKMQSKTPVYIMGSPLIHYRRMHKITKKPDARGTIVFPGHSTADIESSYNIEKYCQELKSLPKKFHPLTICLFWPDCVSKNINIYRKAGFKVVTAGPRFKKGLQFAKNFYKILSTNQYATSNEIGSFTFYALDMGIPFFLTGEIPLNINTQGLNKDMGETARIDQQYFGRKAIKMFSTGPITKILPHQRKFADDEMGLDDCLAPKQMNELLWNYRNRDPRRYTGTLAYWAICVLLALQLSNLTNHVLEISRKILKKSGGKK